jgi:hypothetical protein
MFLSAKPNKKATYFAGQLSTKHPRRRASRPVEHFFQHEKMNRNIKICWKSQLARLPNVDEGWENENKMDKKGKKRDGRN